MILKNGNELLNRLVAYKAYFKVRPATAATSWGTPLTSFRSEKPIDLGLISVPKILIRVPGSDGSSDW
jgi:hypothetical protein